MSIGQTLAEKMLSKAVKVPRSEHPKEQRKPPSVDQDERKPSKKPQRPISYRPSLPSSYKPETAICCNTCNLVFRLDRGRNEPPRLICCEHRPTPPPPPPKLDLTEGSWPLVTVQIQRIKAAAEEFEAWAKGFDVLPHGACHYHQQLQHLLPKRKPKFEKKPKKEFKPKLVEKPPEKIPGKYVPKEYDKPIEFDSICHAPFTDRQQTFVTMYQRGATPVLCPTCQKPFSVKKFKLLCSACKTEQLEAPCPSGCSSEKRVVNESPVQAKVENV